jgi:hypothetical protein
MDFANGGHFGDEWAMQAYQRVIARGHPHTI